MESLRHKHASFPPTSLGRENNEQATSGFTKRKFLAEEVKPENKAVLITGCDSGFGHFLAKRLDSKGFHVFATCLFPDGEGTTELKKSCSQRLRVLRLDVTKDDSVKEAAEFVEQNLGTCEFWALVNNAGTIKGFSLELSDMDDIKYTLDVNTLGPIRMIKEFLPLLKKSKGRIVNVTSLAAEIYILSSKQPPQKIWFNKDRMLKMVIVYEVLLFSVQKIHHPSLPKIQRGIYYKIAF
ncbi:estradiol 17-beta-dehydrogenase 2 [Trichonephila clavipes]|nr:estradiol 17-beta-dehydrogenase 2 [Trichonephila clavipes]